MWSRLQLLGAALLFSTGGFAVKSCGLSGWQVASFRCGVAALTLFVLLPASRRRWHLREVAVGCAYAATLVCYALATKATTAANAIFLQSTAPLYILLLSPWILGERPRRQDLVLAAAMAVGLGLVLSGDDVASASAPDPARGNLFGALAGACWALTVIGLRWLSPRATESTGPKGRSGGKAEVGRNAAAVSLVAGNVIGFVACLPMALPVVDTTPTDWAWVIFLGVVQISFAYLLLTAGLRGVPAFEASLLLLAEPVFNPLWTWWLHHEVPSSGAVAGGGLILAATVIQTWVDLRRRRRLSASARAGGTAYELSTD